MKYIFIFLSFLSNYVSFSQNNTNKVIPIVVDSILIPTQSGKEIFAYIATKKDTQEPLPAILFYTTYYQGKSDSKIAERSANKDYVGIVAYTRGIKTNLNDYQPYENEKDDIYDIIEWISKQKWCNGKVGMYGGSYTGFSQWSAAKKIHPALKTIVPQVAVMPGFDFPMENNVELNLGLYWPHENIYKRKPIRRSLPFEWFENGIAWNKMDSLEGNQNKMFQKWLQHPSYDKYWKSLVPTPDDYTKINIPILTTTGYYDGSQISALQYYNLHNKYNKKANHYFVIGPYDHWGGQFKASKKIMGYEIDNVANINMIDLVYEWLDFILKDKPKPSLLKDKFNYQVMGSNTWKHTESLSKINTDTLTFYLDENRLNLNKPKNKNYRNQEIDFKNRDSQNNYYTPEIIFDTLDASNGLIFTTDILKEDFYINGSFTGNLLTTINKKDLDISLALYEIMPNGKYFFLTRYLGRASYAKDNSKRMLLKPNKKQSIPIKNTRFISKKISKGSRLIILLNSNKHPFEIINYGTGKTVASENINDAYEPLKIKWHNDSFINIPISKN